MITDSPQIDTYYQALLDRDPSYLGIFYVGVKTTSIFCISTCRARKPKKENVEFFSSLKETLDHGYRPCKVCLPTQNSHPVPEPVKKAIQLVKDHPKEKISDQRLRENEIAPEQVRRWFNKTYGITFHAYQRMFRINSAFEELKQGKNATSAAFDSGYDSLSGFGYTYKKLMGRAPSKQAPQSPILVHRFSTPLGPMLVGATEKGICLLEFVDRRMLETEFGDIQRYLKAPIFPGENAHTRQAVKEMEEYFAGHRQQFDLLLQPLGTDFQQSVWQGLLDIPYGATSTYKKMASNINKPNAIRALGTANGANRIAIVVPCHRVIGEDGKLRGYGGGLERKQWLLEHEARHLAHSPQD